MPRATLVQEKALDETRLYKGSDDGLRNRTSKAINEIPDSCRFDSHGCAGEATSSKAWVNSSRVSSRLRLEFS